MQKTEFYDSYNCGYDLSSIIQKEIDDGWIVKHVIQIPFETYHGGDLFKPQIAVTIVFEKYRKQVRNLMKTHPSKTPIWFLFAMFIIALVVISWLTSFVWLVGK